MSTLLKPTRLAVYWQEGACVLMDQQRLPGTETYHHCRDYREVVQHIKDLVVRGAPAIGVSGAYGVVLAVRQSLDLPEGERAAWLAKAFGELEAARPTAVNLSWAVEKMKRVLGDGIPSEQTVATLLAAATAIQEQDIEANRRMADAGADWLPEGNLLTYCNTGDLATGGIGTALGVIHGAYLRGKCPHVYTCETRPVLQGLRLTAWELQQRQIPFTSICDNMAATLMARGKVQGVVLGSDRIAANGDVANKIGTYGLAVLCQYHKIPFMVAAPVSTFDLSLESGDQIPIEERDPEEILRILGDNRPETPYNTFNPSFDVTPHGLVSAIVCEKGVIDPVNAETLRAVVGKP